MGEWFGGLTARALDATSQGSPEALAALFLVSALTEVGVPFPLLLDSVLFLMGYQLGQVWLQTIAIIFALTLGREAGSTVVYWLSHAAGSPLVGRLGRSSLLGKRIAHPTETGQKQTYLAVVLSRLGARSIAPAAALGVRTSYTVAVARITPGLLTAVSVVSGIVRLPYRYFALGIALASVFADLAVIGLGVIMRLGLLYFGLTPAPWLIVVGGIINLVLVSVLALLLWRRRQRR